MSASVFILWHVPEGDEYKENAKLIGVYRSHDDCNAAIARLKGQPGFRDYLPGFEFFEYELNKDHWTEGFISWDEAADAFENDTKNDQSGD